MVRVKENLFLIFCVKPPSARLGVGAELGNLMVCRLPCQNFRSQNNALRMKTWHFQGIDLCMK